MKLQVIRQRSLWWTISSVIILSGIVAMVISWNQIGSPLRPSLDFVGGTRLQLELDCTQPNNCDDSIEPGEVRQVLAEQDLGSSSIQVLGDERHALSIRTSVLDVNQRTQLLSALSEQIGTFDPQATQIDTVGPTLGRQLLSSGLLALVVSFVGITVYLSLRFQLDYAVFAIVALFHDVLITVGIFAILGLTIGAEVDSLFIVALLTIVGFSVNDTVVIYDRIRETMQQEPSRNINDIVDDAVNQTLTRSINTSVTVLLTLSSIFLFGGETLKYFALALIIGFTMGAYSSIFIASTLLALWRERFGQPIPVPLDSSSSDDA
ncbi:protein translocase subunit SecF [Leptolyngbya sp. FACHB-541]|uniref:protein translocase subunit SecF n=1 Tax=Leptolyngbya sp. FACHB-541 TaxID=2692810 RepID=UPI00168959D6|nr:protein translocase subunit SecF [Leptolyngbya sp. FACHB-541]MBD1996676.1 protein translocase subunit SecF [Leptolyngbya sp. FACHB-541]